MERWQEMKAFVWGFERTFRSFLILFKRMVDTSHSFLFFFVEFGVDFRSLADRQLWIEVQHSSWLMAVLCQISRYIIITVLKRHQLEL